MLMRRARAYSSFCSQVVLVYLYPFRRNSFFCSPKSRKKSPNPLLWGSRSFRVINDDISKMLVASAFYDMQHVRAYLQPFSP